MKIALKWLLSFLLVVFCSLSYANNPRLSIIVCTGQNSFLLDSLMQNLFQQTVFPQAEIVLVGQKKDCSQRVKNCLAVYKNVIFLDIGTVQDFHHLVNYGIMRARGDFIFWAHAGDFYEPNYLEKQLDLLIATPQADVVYSDYEWSYEPNQPLKRAAHNFSVVPEFDPYCFSVCLPGPVPMWRKSLHKRLGYFDSEFKYTAVWAFWKKAVSKGVLFIKSDQSGVCHYFDTAETKCSDFPARTMQMLQEEQKVLKRYPAPVLVQEQQKPMVIIIPSYNNEYWCKRNLESIFMQYYTNYRIIYIDDRSADNTAALVQALIKDAGYQDRCIFLRNATRQGCPLANIYTALQLCKPGEIAVILDGDDWLAHENVLSYLNSVYQDPHVWLTYGQFAIFPYSMLGWAAQVPKEVVAQNSIRDYRWCTNHLRTFYVWLFNHTTREDFMYQGRFFPMAGDLALMYPLVELAGEHAHFIPHMMYTYNRANALNEDKMNIDLQKACESGARQGKRYKPFLDIPMATQIK